MSSRVNVAEAVAWAAVNYERIVREDANGRIVFKWEMALSPPPSDIARSYLKFASSNPTQFFSRTVPQFLSDNSGGEDSIVHDRKMVSAIRSTLRKFTEQMEREREETKPEKDDQKEEGQKGQEAAGDEAS